jgi:hypothetical protein
MGRTRRVDLIEVIYSTDFVNCEGWEFYGNLAAELAHSGRKSAQAIAERIRPVLAKDAPLLCNEELRPPCMIGTPPGAEEIH